MKVKYLLLALLTIIFIGCDDNTGALGLEMFPGSDQNVNGKSTTFEVTTQSQLAEDVFAKTSVGYLGKFTDPNFGFFEAGFLAQIHCYEGFTFPAYCDVNNEADLENPKALMTSNDIYRTELRLWYTSYFGDSLAASRLSVYELDKNLNKTEAYYTSIDPKEYYNPSDLLGRKAYTAYDPAVSDSLRNAWGRDWIIVTLPTALGQRIYDKSRECEANGEDFAPYFMDLFKGIYVKNDYGDGTVLYITEIELNVIYEVYVRDSDTGEIYKTHDETADSTAYTWSSFVATKEIIQANSFKSDEALIKQKVEETNWTYLKTPAGIYTQATLPLEKFEEELSQDTLNVVNLTFTNYNQTDDENKYAFPMSAPTYLLLVREKDRENFFINNEINDNVTSYITQQNLIYTNQYVFSNISQLVTTCIEEKKAAEIELETYGKISNVLGSNGEAVTTIDQWKEATQWDKIAVIPISVVFDSNSNIVGILNDLQPGYTKLKGGLTGSKLDLNVIYTSFTK